MSVGRVADLERRIDFVGTAERFGSQQQDHEFDSLVMESGKNKY